MSVAESTLGKAIAIIPKVFGSLSLLASTAIMRDVIIKWRGNKSIPFTSIIVFCISAADWLYSFFGAFLSTWLAPADSGRYLASGNVQTCEAQGFIVALSIAASMSYYAELMILYLMIIRFGWTESHMGKLGLRLSFILPPIVISLGIAIPPIFLEFYNDSGFYTCFIAPYPTWCEFDPAIECIRGEGALYYWSSFWVYNFICNIIIILSVLLLIWTVLMQEKKTDKYLTKGQEKMRKNTIRTFWQGMRYVGAFMLAYFTLYVYNVYYHHTRTMPPKPVIYLHLITTPSLGLFNSYVYFRPRYLTYRERNPNDAWIKCLCNVFNVDLDLSLQIERNDSESGGTIQEEDLATPLFQPAEGS